MSTTIGSSPGWDDGYVPPASEWNSWWATKLDAADPLVTGGPYLPLSGGQLAGPLLLGSLHPISDNEATSKKYVDDAIFGVGAGFYVPLSGGSMSGPLLLSGNPTNALGAVPKQYSDTKLALAGGTLTGTLITQDIQTIGPVNRIWLQNTDKPNWIWGNQNDGAVLGACGFQVVTWNGVGFSPSIGAFGSGTPPQGVPYGLNAVVVNTRTGDVTGTGRLMMRDTQLNGYNQLGMFRFVRDTATTVAMQVLGNIGFLSIADAGGGMGTGSGGTGYAVNDRLYDTTFQCTYTVLAVDGTGAITQIRMDKMGSGIPSQVTNPIPLVNAPSYVTGSGATVQLAVTIPATVSILAPGDLYLNSATVRTLTALQVGDLTASRNCLTITRGTSLGAAITAAASGSGQLQFNVPGGVAHTGGTLAVGAAGSNNALTITPGAATTNPITINASGTGNINITGGTGVYVGGTLSANAVQAGVGSTNALTIAPGASAGANTNISVNGTGLIDIQSPARIRGNIDGTAVVAGYIGEYMASNVATPGVALTSATYTQVTSLTLTPGDWDVNGSVGFGLTGATTINVQAVITTTAPPTSPGINNGIATSLNITAGNNNIFPAGTGGRINVSTPTTVYLVGFANFSGGTMTVWGFMKARRVR